jgi:hypothetical protein
MPQDDRYEAEAPPLAVWDKQMQRRISTDAPKSKVPTYRHAQKEAMKTGDVGTYNMNKTKKKGLDQYFRTGDDAMEWDSRQPGRKDR